MSEMVRQQMFVVAVFNFLFFNFIISLYNPAVNFIWFLLGKFYPLVRMCMDYKYVDTMYLYMYTYMSK